MNRKYGKKSLALLLALLIIASQLPVHAFAEEEPTEVLYADQVPESDSTAENSHNLAFASDLHNTGALETAMADFPEDTEYVALIGDMVGARGGDAPEYRSSDILDQIQEVLPELTAENAAIIWADHDRGVIDDTEPGMVQGMDGVGSGPVYEGLNEDGTTAYYVYAVGFYHMTSGGEVSQEAAAAFKDWVRDKDTDIPVLVLCHVPLQAARGDNKGASYWNESLNFAATGKEGLVSETDEAEIVRNVLYLYGHNHTIDKTEYVFQAGTAMSVQIDSAGEDNDAPPPLPPEGSASDGQPGEPGQRPGSGRQAEGVLSKIFYTAFIPGYLKTSGNATLVNISDAFITLTKYNGGQAVSLGTDGASGEILDSSLVIPRILRVIPVPADTGWAYYAVPLYLLRGDNSGFWLRGSGDYRFVISRTDGKALGALKAAFVDGEVLPEDAYVLDSESLSFVLREGIQENFSNDLHTLTLEFEDGSAVMAFTVSQPLCSAAA